MRDRIYFRNDRCLRHKSLRRNNLILSSGLPQVMRQHYTAAYTIAKALKTIVLTIVQLLLAILWRDRQRRARITREDMIHGKNLPTRIQRFTQSKATELCTAAYTIAKALKTIVLTIVQLLLVILWRDRENGTGVIRGDIFAVNISDLKPRPSDSERCPVLSGVIIIFMKKQK